MLPTNKEQYKSECKRREEACNRLCKTLCTSRAFICDLLLSKISGYPCLDPQNLERWLRQHHKMGGDESIREAMEREFGKEITDLVERLIENVSDRRWSARVFVAAPEIWVVFVFKIFSYTLLISFRRCDIMCGVLREKKFLQ